MLFRAEAVDSKKQSLTGDVVLYQPIKYYLILLGASISLIVLAIFITQTNYTRKSTVRGFLVPKEGVIKVYSERIAIIDKLLVKNGDTVSKGTPILTLSNNQTMDSGEELSEDLVNQLYQQIGFLNHQLEVNSILYNKEIKSLNNQLKQLKISISTEIKSKVISSQIVDIKQERYDSYQKIFDKGFISNNDMEKINSEYLETVQKDNDISKSISNMKSEALKLKSTIASLPQNQELAKIRINKEISELKSRIFTLKNKFHFIKKAPQSGIVTAIQISKGSHLVVGSPVLSIIPENSPLEIELLLPSKSAGFIKIGDKVKIRFDAFPYEKFGMVIGEIVNIDRAVILPNDKLLPIAVHEAVYKVRASLSKQSISAYGKQFPLKAGMMADADIILDKRSLLEWLLDPIYAIRGRVS